MRLSYNIDISKESEKVENDDRVGYRDNVQTLEILINKAMEQEQN